MNASVTSDLALTDALIAMGRRLLGAGYAFTTVTPATQARVNARPEAQLAHTLRDVFGWSRPFAPGLLPEEAMVLLRSARLLAEEPGGLLRSRVRYATLAGGLYAHSGYPTTDPDAVFFGPDTVRFADLVLAELQREPLRHGARILDLGCGAGPGGLVAAQACDGLQPRLVLADINPRALRFAAANAALAGRTRVAFALGDLFQAVQGDFDLVVANPPYLNDAAQRTYRHGGGDWGVGLSERIVREGLPRLAPGGRLVLYTGAAIVGGRDPLLESLRPTLDLRGWPWRYREIDPDVFGEELLEPAYARAERIAAVALVVRRPA
ncbi:MULTISPECIES: methyltransferase [Ramlibacter]|uniref:Methyltransferase n=1 Tax=Ramlibacter pinisoli TaxID=2682844 RepID=A0A6N8IYC8_9BURK|nr:MULTISPECIES: methyltransferase [Ramlibacter]MBA2962041.1 methyltransferase [Ramlibacter sp. CGMCC 1.13660]MVQ31984.1 methyltransferase [Ramlibacter pinisoli]